MIFESSCESEQVATSLKAFFTVIKDSAFDLLKKY